MINATVSNNVERKEIIVSPDTTVRQAFNQAGIDYGNGVVSVNGTSVRGTQMDMTISDLGFSSGSRIFIMSVVKADNAM